MVDIEVLNGLLQPKSVAVIGASATPGKIGFTVLKNLQESKYEGGIYPINPNAERDVFSLPFNKSVLDVKDKIDLAIFYVLNRFIPNNLKVYVKKGQNIQFHNNK